MSLLGNRVFVTKKLPQDVVFLAIVPLPLRGLICPANPTGVAAFLSNQSINKTSKVRIFFLWGANSVTILCCLECKCLENICSCIATLASSQRIQPNYLWSYSFLREKRELKTLQRAERNEG